MRSLEGERALDHFKQNADGQSLELGSPIDRELAGGESHSYDIALASAQYMRVSVAQTGINVKLKLSGPDTKQIAEVNNQNNAQLQEQVSVVSDVPGKYYLEVSAVEKTALAGRYTVVVEELRAATLQDTTHISAERAYAQAELLRLNGTAESLRESKEKYEGALTMWRELGDHREEANTLHSIGLVHRLLGETQKALDYYNQALPLRRESGDLYGEAMTLHNIGAVYWNLGDNQKALDYYNQALPLRRAARDVWGESATLSNIGAAYGVLGDNQKALDYYNESLPLRREARDRAGEGETLSNLSTLYLRMGELQKALDYANQSLVLRREAGDKRGEAFSLMSVASIHFTSNEYSKALESFHQAVSLSKTSGDRRGQAIALTNVGTVYLQLGESQKGLDYYSEAHPLFQAIGDRANEAGVLGRIGSIYKQMGEYQKALDYHHQSLRISRAVGDRPAEAISVTGIGAVYADMGEKQKAMESYNQALPLHRLVGNRRGEASTLNSMGAIYEQLGDKQKGLEYYGQALLIQRAIGERSDEATTLMSIARIERKRGDLNEAHAHVRAALDIIESARTNVPGQDLRASYIASKQSGYKFYVDLLIQLDESYPGEGYAAKALLTNERFRARSLLETLAEVRADIRNGVEPLLLERERSLQRRLNAKALAQAQLVSSHSRRDSSGHSLVSKLFAYEKSAPSNEVALVADRNDGFDFEQASTGLRELMPASLRVSEIFRSRSDDLSARSQLLAPQSIADRRSSITRVMAL